MLTDTTRADRPTDLVEMRALIASVTCLLAMVLKTKNSTTEFDGDDKCSCSLNCTH